MRAESRQPAAEATAKERDALAALIASSAVTPAFQPIVCLSRGEIAGFEALSRPASGYGFAGPAELFDVAQRAGRLWDLEVVTRAACLARAADFPDGILLFFNSTPEVFADERFAPSLATLLEASGVLPSRVVLEITEASGEELGASLLTQVRSLRRLGFQVAVDDAGAGTSGLARILTLRPHWLKLDRALVAGVDRDRYQHNLVRILVHFARLSGVNLVAEGIERVEELDTLIDLGVGYAQGYLLGKPLPHYQNLSDEMRQRILARGARSGRSDDREGIPRVEALVTPTPAIQAAMSADDARQVLAARRDADGLVVLDGTRVVGWCPRRAVEEAPGGAVSTLARDAGRPLDHGVTLREALERASSCSRDDAPVSPLIVTDDQRVLGVVSHGTLMAAAARVLSGNSAAPLDNDLVRLPGAVAVDEHLRNRFSHAQRVRSAGGASSAGAAFIDVIRFREFNERAGYPAGDQLLADIARLLKGLFHGPDDFVGHLGADRFLIVAPGSDLSTRVRHALDAFDRQAAGLHANAAEPDEPAPSSERSPRTALRAMVLVDAFSGTGSARQVFALFDEMRRNVQQPSRETDASPRFPSQSELLVAA